MSFLCLLADNGTKLQWRNRLAHGTYRQYKRHAGVVSSSLTWSIIFVRRVLWPTETVLIKLLQTMRSSRGRVVKALDLKSNGVSPRRFESCRLRTNFVPPAIAQGLNFVQIFTWLTEASIAQWQSTGLVNQGSRVQSSLEAFLAFILTSSVKKKNIPAPPGNRTRVARMGILHDTTTPAAHSCWLE